MSDLERRLDVRLRDRLLLGLGAREAPGVDVDRAQGLRLLDDDRAAVGQVHFDLADAFDFALEVEGLEDRRPRVVVPHAVDQFGRDSLDELDDVLVGLLVVQEVDVDLVGEDVPRGLEGEVQVPMKQGRGIGGLELLLDSLPGAEQVFDLALEVLGAGSLGLGAHDHPLAPEVLGHEAVDDRGEPHALLGLLDVL